MIKKDVKKSLIVSLHFPPQTGGEQVYYYNLAKHLPGDKVVALVPTEKNEKFDLNQSFTIIRSKNLHNIYQSLHSKIAAVLKKIKNSNEKLKKEISSIILRHKIEVIHVGQILPIGEIVMPIALKKKIPYILYAHGLDVSLIKNSPEKAKKAKKIIKNSYHIITNSFFTRDILLELGASREQIDVINPCPNISSEEAADWRISEIKQNLEIKNKKILFTLGRLVERKGHDMVIKALPGILKKEPNTVYLIAGEGPMKQKLVKLANSLKLGEHVIFLGKVSDKDLSAYFQMADVYIMPNKEMKNNDVEGFGIVFLEAGLFALPVIGGNNGGVNEAIVDGQTGLLVDPQDIGDITQKTIRLLTDDALAAKLGMQGLARSSEFTWPEQIEKIKDLIQNGKN